MKHLLIFLLTLSCAYGQTINFVPYYNSKISIAENKNASDSTSFEVTKEVRTIEVDRVCGKNGCDGKMRSTGIALTSNPLQYPHECEKCHSSNIFFVTYPYIKYEHL